MGQQDKPSTKPRLDKLGVKPGQRIAVLDIDDPSFVEELLDRTDSVFLGRRRASCDLLFIGARQRGTLQRLRVHRQFIKPDGAIWVVWPKGTPGINENDVRGAALGAGLVDVKVVSFSDRLSALKLVIPVEQRKKQA